MKKGVYTVTVEGGWLKRSYVFNSAISIGLLKHTLSAIMALNVDSLQCLALDKWKDEFEKKYPEYDFEVPIVIPNHEHYDVFELNGVIIKISRDSVLDSNLLAEARRKGESIT